MLYKKAPELSSIDGYINTGGAPITLASLKGKVVLLDIWTYSCINCQRTLPYIIDWYAKYKDSGLVVVGLHTPEFGFEKVQANVERAVQGFHITYPVVLDNDYSTWKALGNQYWPRKYLIDSDGYIVYDHIGEGNYDETEKAIQRALKEREARLGMNDTVSQATSSPLHVVSFEPDRIKSPEVYFGSSRNDYFANGKRDLDGVQALTLPSHILSNALYLEGNWNFTSEYAENMDAATIVFNYDAKNVYMAAGSGVGATIEIFKDDVFVKKVTVTDETLYPLIEGTSYGAHTLRIKITKPGLRAFTFTFG
jgi:thiol-disulfide isomerase/thioredoxin